MTDIIKRSPDTQTVYGEYTDRTVTYSDNLGNTLIAHQHSDSRPGMDSYWAELIFHDNTEATRSAAAEVNALAKALFWNPSDNRDQQAEVDTSPLEAEHQREVGRHVAPETGGGSRNNRGWGDRGDRPSRQPR